MWPGKFPLRTWVCCCAWKMLCVSIRCEKLISSTPCSHVNLLLEVSFLNSSSEERIIEDPHTRGLLVLICKNTDVGIPASSHCRVKCETYSLTVGVGKGSVEEHIMSQGCSSVSWMKCSKNFALLLVPLWP